MEEIARYARVETVRRAAIAVEGACGGYFTYMRTAKCVDLPPNHCSICSWV